MEIQLADYQSLVSMGQRTNALTPYEVRELILKLQNALFDMNALEATTGVSWFLLLIRRK